MLYSLLGTCKMQDIEPNQWLRNTLEKIAPNTINRINSFQLLLNKNINSH